MKNTSESPFERMYDSFSLFAKSAIKKPSKRIVYMSSGINWMEANKSVLNLLCQELKSAISYRNYGRSAGAKIITDLLEFIEIERFRSESCDEKLRPSITITNGASEGSYLLIKLLSDSGFFDERRNTLMIGHGFPLYAKLSDKFNLSFLECLGNKDSVTSLLPKVEEIELYIKNLSLPWSSFLIQITL